MKSWFNWTILAVVSWGVWAVISRLIGDALTPAQGHALSTLGMLPIIAVLATSHGARSSRREITGMAWALAAGVITSLGNIAYYKVLNGGAKAVTVVPLTAIYPVVTLVLGLIFLKERLSPMQKFGVVLAFVAIYLFNFQGVTTISAAWLWAAFLPILFWGVSGFLQKLATNYLSGELSALCFLVSFVPVGVIILVHEPLHGVPSLKVLGYASLLGFTLGFGNFAIQQAYARKGKAAVIAPLGSLYPVISLPIAMIAFKENVGWREGLAIAISCVAVAALAVEKRETK